MAEGRIDGVSNHSEYLTFPPGDNLLSRVLLVCKLRASKADCIRTSFPANNSSSENFGFPLWPCSSLLVEMDKRTRVARLSRDAGLRGFHHLGGEVDDLRRNHEDGEQSSDRSRSVEQPRRRAVLEVIDGGVRWQCGDHIVDAEAPAVNLNVVRFATDLLHP